MLNRNSVIAVTSRSFSANAELRNKLSSYFPNARFNESGKALSDENLVIATSTVESFEQIWSWRRWRGLSGFEIS